MAYDFKVSNGQIVVGDSYVGKDEINHFFEEHKLIRGGFTNEEIMSLIEAVAFYLDGEMTMEEDADIIFEMLGIES